MCIASCTASLCISSSLIVQMVRWALALPLCHRCAVKPLRCRLPPSSGHHHHLTALAQQPQRAMTTSTAPSPFLVMDAFCLRSFLPSGQSGGSTSLPCSPDDFVLHVNRVYEEGQQRLQDGYAPFCKHLFIPNHLDVQAAYTAVTQHNRHLLQSEYVARTEKELPVLMRHFPAAAVKAEKATWLDVILYSRQQIDKENHSMSSQPSLSPSPPLPPLSRPLSSASEAREWQWGIVSIKPQTVSHEVPMLPITMMRNALGVEEGGSGVKLDRDKYRQSVDFWTAHAAVQ